MCLTQNRHRANPPSKHCVLPALECASQEKRFLQFHGDLPALVTSTCSDAGLWEPGI